MSREEVLNMLGELFELKLHNPVVSFWFCGKADMESGDVNKPADFDRYNLLDEKTDADGIVWLCYGKKESRGIFARSYWHK